MTSLTQVWCNMSIIHEVCVSMRCMDEAAPPQPLEEWSRCPAASRVRGTSHQPHPASRHGQAKEMPGQGGSNRTNVASRRPGQESTRASPDPDSASVTHDAVLMGTWRVSRRVAMVMVTVEAGMIS